MIGFPNLAMSPVLELILTLPKLITVGPMAFSSVKYGALNFSALRSNWYSGRPPTSASCRFVKSRIKIVLNSIVNLKRKHYKIIIQLAIERTFAAFQSARKDIRNGFEGTNLLALS